MKREKRLTKREQKALKGPSPAVRAVHENEHIHCVACGRHLAPDEFTGTPGGAKATATRLRCQHGGVFPSCVACTTATRRLLEEHDRTGQPVRSVEAWH